MLEANTILHTVLVNNYGGLFDQDRSRITSKYTIVAQIKLYFRAPKST